MNDNMSKISELNYIWNKIITDFFIDTDSISELETNGDTLNIFVVEDGLRKRYTGYFKSYDEYINSTLEFAKFISGTNELPEFLAEGKIDLGQCGRARVHIVLPPASDYPLVTIAKKTTSLTTLDKIYRNGSMSAKSYNFLKAAVDIRQTIVFSGSTGSGKTTMLEAMTKYIPSGLRIGVVEDAPELTLDQSNVVYLHSKPWHPGMDPNREVTLDWCTRQINRMRTDVLIVGETRGKEFKEFLTASNSGMEGSMTTLHANSPKMALQKMAQFVMEAQQQPIRVINKAISTSIDLVVQLTKNSKGEYKVQSIEEVSSILNRDEDASIATTPLTSYDEYTKSWDDTFFLSDKLRQALTSKGYDCNSFTKNGDQIGGRRMPIL